MKNIPKSRFQIGLIAALLLPASNAAFAHPGSLDSNDCHRVSKRFTYTSGLVAKRGEVHCHRGLDEIKFDDKEVLRSDEDSLKQKAPANKGRVK